jgi:iron complex transport system substrate-binding protein
VDSGSVKNLPVRDAHSVRRIVSLQPSITLTLAELGALDKLVACTKYCAEVCAEVVERKIPLVQDSWTAQTDQITRLKPDLVLASVPYQMESLSNILKAGVPVVCLSPRHLADVYGDIALLGRIVEKVQEAEDLIFAMQCEIESCRVRTTQLHPKPTVYCEEWGKPLIQSQGWVKELIEIAGGVMIGEAGATTSAVAVRELNPDVVLAAWCGAGDRVPLKKIVRDRGWEQMSAVQSSRVFCINDEFLNTPATCLLKGLKAITWALHPDVFEKPEGIRRIDSES